MSNPWLNIPLSDYEQHMSLPEVQQFGALADLFAEALARCSQDQGERQSSAWLTSSSKPSPSSVAILGIAGGNGLDRIDSNTTKRIVGLDVNPEYLDAARHRYSRIAGLELCRVDLANDILQLEAVQLVHAALVFEHAGTDRCLDNAVSLVAPNGTLSIVLQLPSQLAHRVAPSGVASMQSLKSHFAFVDPQWLGHTLEARGLRLTYETRYALPAGKAFWMGLFGRR
jgi:hypothetical protein